MSPDGTEMAEEDWHNPQARALMMRLDGRAPASGLRQVAANVTLLMLLNANPEDVVFHLPTVEGEHWRVQIDTSGRSNARAVPAGAAWTALGRSLALMAVEQDSAAAAERAD